MVIVSPASLLSDFDAIDTTVADFIMFGAVHGVIMLVAVGDEVIELVIVNDCEIVETAVMTPPGNARNNSKINKPSCKSICVDASDV